MSVSADASRTLVLASASPRRRQLLAGMGVTFEVRPAPLDELTRKPAAVGAGHWAAALAYFKARATAAQVPARWILGADTIVACAGRLLGKPRDRDDARRMLELQAGSPSDVITGVAFVRLSGEGHPEARILLAERTRIWMHDRPALREAWLASEQWRGKAGAYGIQDVGDQLVARREGSLTNVVGLPVERVAPVLGRLGLVR